MEQSDKAIIIYYLVIVRGRGEGERKEGVLAVSVLCFLPWHWPLFIEEVSLF